MTSVQEYFKFNDELNPMKNNQWRKGGMTSNGLRRAGEVINHFRGPGRQNLIPDAVSKADLGSTDPSLKVPVSSIGWVQTNGLGQVAASEYGPGTLKSTNIEIRTPNVPSADQQGHVLQNDKRSQFVDYRSTDPSLVENLRQNPLSIYAVGGAKDAEIPAFFSYVRPDNYDTYKTDPEVEITEWTKELAIDGSPNVNILGMGSQNPLMGITTGIPNDAPTFSGKTYGGNDSGDARFYAESLYNTAWKGNYGENVVENFGGSGLCKNKALSHFAQGYNISEQINDKKMIEWVDKGMHGVTNIPWGPKKVTGDPRTQQGGLWLGEQKTMDTPFGYRNSRDLYGDFMLQKAKINSYRNGLPGNLIES